MALLEVSHLGVGFRGADGEKDNAAVDDVSFALEAGEVLGVVGESGSGKSVTALSILGLLPYPKAYHMPGSSVRFAGRELIGAPEEELRRVRGNEIAFVFQEPMSSLNPLHTIEKQIGETLRLHRQLSEKEAKKEVLRLLKMTGIKNARARMKAYPFELSGGQRQRVMIAMAIANHPKILIADEPTTALDVTIQAQIIDLLMDLRKKMDMAIIFISHDLRIVRKIADRIAVMKNGRIVEQGDSVKIFENPEADYTKKLIGAHSSLKLHNNISNDVVLSVENAEVRFPVKKSFWGSVRQEIKAVDRVSFELRRGETLGIVGESGSGKTTLGMAVVNLIKSSGRFCLYNIEKQPIKRESKSFRKTIQIVFQDPYNSLNPRMNIEQIVAEGLEVHYSGLSKKDKKERVIKVLSEVGLGAEVLNKYPHEFSGGQRQRVGIARTLALNPDFIVCDEPISALDVSIQAQIINLLEKIQDEQGISYLFIAHDLGMVKHISHKIGVMYLGHLVEFGDADEVYNHPLHPYTEALMSAAPIPDPKLARESKRIMLKGEIPSPLDMPTGCPFASRCPRCREECLAGPPIMVNVGDRKVACFDYL